MYIYFFNRNIVFNCAYEYSKKVISQLLHNAVDKVNVCCDSLVGVGLCHPPMTFYIKLVKTSLTSKVNK